MEEPTTSMTFWNKIQAFLLMPEVVDKVDNHTQTDRKRLSDEECRRGKMQIERGFMSI
ncbi:hypothetical protein J32TS2_05660 [Shouchella clausii]|jgi:hypothetical protein|nr:hypothetical protein DB29_03132 [Shouchella clausii]GIN15210.1 hypothetical protein J32TS2_05660 [Shouchella clausii]